MWLETKPGATGVGVRAGDMCARIQALPQSPSGPNLNRPRGWDVQKFQKLRPRLSRHVQDVRLPLFNQVCMSAPMQSSAPDLQGHPHYPKEDSRTAQPHRRTGTVVKDRTSHTMRTKRRTLRAHLLQGPLRAALRNKDLLYYEYIVYISLVSIYFVIITTLDVIG